MDISQLVTRQRAYFFTGATRPLSFRLAALRRLRSALTANEALIFNALKQDLNKHPMESYMSELGLVLEEIRYHLKHLPHWIREKTVPSPLAQFHARSFISPEPYGVALLMSPWNYPIQLCLSPLVGMISAGNCAVVKPSAYAPATSAVVEKILGEVFPSEFVAVIEGGRAQNRALLEEQFDYIFFTGSVAVGKTVMAAASRFLTPVTLELGGKSPVIIDKSANLKLAARRLAFGKVLNAGQTCVGADYLLVHESVKDPFVAAFRQALSEFFPSGDYTNLPTIVSEKHYQRLKNLLVGEKILLGGGTDDSRRFIEPTLLDQVSPDAPVMQEEIFGPILPILTWKSLDQCVEFIRARPKPLALYLFTSDKGAERKVLSSCSFGGGCINDTIIHLATSHMAFGGVGESGMGSYHGKNSFDTFSHFRSIVKKYTWLDMPMRYHPYQETKFKLIRKFLK